MSITPENSVNTVDLPTIGQIERRVSQSIQKLWRTKTGQFPKPTISLFFERKLIIWLGNSLTPLTQLLIRSGKDPELKDRAVDQMMKQEVRECLSEILGGCSIETILIDTDPDENCTGIMVMLDRLPAVRNSDAVPKTKD